MRKIILANILIILFSAHGNSQTGWFQLNSGTTMTLNSVYFLNSNTGFIGGGSLLGGGFLRTNNGGLNWTSVSLDMGVFSTYFIDANMGFAVGHKWVYPPPPPTVYGKIYRTFNGGSNWDLVLQTTSVHPTSVFFINANTGFVGADFISGPGIYRTTNGGSNWALQIVGSSAAENSSLHFPGANVGYFACRGIYMTTNVGLNWIMQNPGTSEYLYSVFFVDLNTGYCTGTTGTIVKTTTGGALWEVQPSNTASYLYSVYFINYNTGYAVGESGKILKTTNGGSNWLNQLSGTGNTLRSVFFIDSLTGYAAGYTGTILKTTNGGITAIEPISNKFPNDFSLRQNYPNPFNPVTKIKFDVPAPLNPPFSQRGEERSGGGFVTLRVYDILGRQVTTLVNEELQPGTYEIEWDGMNYPSGVYYYKLTAEHYTETRKMILIK